ncbi:MAG: protein kinase [Deltaproteobacteria bacterium]|nr:protein kinase [Deltaproteobacteria bacterium]
MRWCPICARPFVSTERFCAVHGLPLVEGHLTAGGRPGELTGHILDYRYRLAGVAGKGGMGVVYEAENLRIGRRCAVKVLHRELHSDPKMRMRLFREVQATSRILHPNVVEILDYGDDEVAGCYLVMEFLDGQSLGQYVREHGRMPLATVCQIAVQLTSALSATHGHGLIHRDLKPSNVRLLPDGRVKVLDFGLVKAYEPHTAEEFMTLSTAGMAFGTPWYMSPEQAMFKPLDPRSDIYSMGALLYELLVGHPPFEGNNPLEVIDAQRKKPVPLPRTLTPPVDITAAAELLLLKALSKDPNDRFQSMAEFMEEVYRVAQAAGVSLHALDLPAAPGGPELRAHPSGAAEAEKDPQAFSIGWTIAVPNTSPDLAELRRLAVERRAGLADRMVASLKQAFPRYRKMDSALLGKAVELLLGTAIDFLADDASPSLPAGLRLIADERAEQQFSLTELVGALWTGFAVCRPVFQEAAGKDLERYAALEDQVDQRILPFLLKMVEYYVSSVHGRLMKLNEALAQRNEELQQLRATLADQVRDATSQLAQATQLKAHVIDSISSGLVLVDRSTRKVLLFNRAMERISGVPGSQILDRPIEEVLTFVEGVPQEEFLEQARMHGQVGLRKLRMRFASGPERAVYVRGDAIVDVDGHPLGMLFILDDVTEREQIIECFSRYVSRDVVDRILRQRAPLRPDGQTCRAVLLSVNIRGFRSLIKELPPTGVVELLTDYIRTVGDAVFHHGGIIDVVVGDGALVYFVPRGDTCLPAVRAAIELHRRLDAVSRERQRTGRPTFEAGIGLHVGEVLVLNVGGERRMVHTVVGEAAQVAQALQEVASGGEILLSAELAKGLGEGLTTEPGPVVAVKGQASPIEALRLVYELEPFDESLALA